MAWPAPFCAHGFQRGKSLNEQHKRLGDLLAGTVVLRERVVAQGGGVAVMPPPLAGWAAGLDLARLPDGLALSARQFLARSDTLTDAAREDLGGRLVRAVTDAVGPPPPGTPGWAVLAAVLAERRRRDTERLTGSAGLRGRTDPAPAAPALPAPAPPVAPQAPAPAPPAVPPDAPAGFVLPS